MKLTNFLIGELLKDGKGIEQNLPQAIKYLLSASLQGHIEAQFMLGFFC